jgi:hypothetical protein
MMQHCITGRVVPLRCHAVWSPISQWYSATSQKNRDRSSGLCTDLRNRHIHIIRPTGNVKSKLMKHLYQSLYQVLKRKFSSGVYSYTWQFHYGKCDVLCAWYVGLAFDSKNGDQKDKWKALKESFENACMTWEKSLRQINPLNHHVTVELS